VSAPVALAVALLAAWFFDLRQARADVALHWASVLQSQKTWPGCIEVYQRAVKLDQAAFSSRSKLAEALMDQATGTRKGASYDQIMREAEQVLNDAKSVSGYNRRAWHLGQLYTVWAEHETEPRRHVELGQQARKALEQALFWEPKNPALWSDYAYVNLFILHNEADGLRENQKALDLDPSSEQALKRFADYYALKSEEPGDAENKRQLRAKAVAFYQRAAEASLDPFAYRIAAGRLTMDLGDWAQAAETFAQAARVAVGDQGCQAEEMLARAYFGAGNHAAAIEHVQIALGKASPQQRPRLTDLESQIRGAK
jgi:tetratricopeptide (TPR) repeat protein